MQLIEEDHICARGDAREAAEPTAHGSARDTRNVGASERIISGLTGGALVGLGLWRRSRASIPLVLAGGAFIYRAATGRCPVYRAIGANTAATGTTGDLEGGAGVEVAGCVTINRPASDLYSYWRNVENLPRFMPNLEAVTALDGSQSHWRVKGLLGRGIEWHAEIFHEHENERIEWRSLPGADIDNAGTVSFRPGPLGTEMEVRINYRSPLGRAGTTVARLLGGDPGTQLDDALRRFKQIMEAGEIPTTDGQTSGRMSSRAANGEEHSRRFAWGTRDSVDQASWESFPASDPPSW